MSRIDSASTAPTERELRLAAEWMRVARLISASIQSRIDFDPDKVDDPIVRYAPLKLLLNDVYVRELNAWGDRETARKLRSIQREKYAQLASAVRKLPELQQEMLRLRFGHGLNSDEIGSVIKKNGSAVRMLLSRTLRHLRGLYKDQAEGGQ